MSLAEILRYHRETKHHPHRFARSLGYLDWATQPRPFRRFTGAPRTRLPLPAGDDAPAYADLFRPGSVPSRAVDRESLSSFLYLTLAVSAWKSAGGSSWALRCNPSSGNLHPTEGYVVLPAIPGVHDHAAVHHYDPYEHALERRIDLAGTCWDSLVPDAAGGPPRVFLVGLTSIHWREIWKYGERAFRYCQHDLGHATACVAFAAAALGWQAQMIGAAGDAQIATLLGLDRHQDFDEHEREAPGVLLVVAPAGDPAPRVDLDLAREVAALPSHGRAERLSSEHVDWPIIETVASAARKPEGTRGEDADTFSPAGEPPLPRTGQSAAVIIRKRRSAVAYDGRGGVSREAFQRMLWLLLPDARAARPPWSTVRWCPSVHLVLFVHAVDGLAPGLYGFVRRPGAFALLKRETRPEFRWQSPEGWPEPLPLFLLEAGDWRARAAHLCLGQEIAGQSAFSLGMIAELEGSLERHGSWAYRRLFWEAGMIGQLLYVEAEAAGLRATGIGAYFDDQVHAVLGLAGDRLQSLYHFTVGTPVEDPRLTTLPAYPPPAGHLAP